MNPHYYIYIYIPMCMGLCVIIEKCFCVNALWVVFAPKNEQSAMST